MIIQCKCVIECECITDFVNMSADSDFCATVTDSSSQQCSMLKVQGLGVVINCVGL